MKKELICFDMDNTLVKSNKVHLRGFQKAFEKNHLTKVTDKEVIKYFGLTGEVLVKELYPELTKEQIKKIVADHDDFVVKETHKYAKAIPGAIRVLKKLKKTHKIAILTNCKHKEIVPVLKSAGIDKKLFNLVLGNDDVKHGKPYPDEIFKAEKLLHVKSAYMVGDSIYDIKAAKKAKAKGIAVLTGDHTKAQLKKEKPLMILKSVRSLPRRLK
jgi:HAD superfamily hydrolase (TIGR01549 family)